MKKTLAVFAIFSASMFAKDITAFVGDSMCGAKHVKGTDDDAKCAQSCVKKGDKIVLVTKEGTVYKVDQAGQEKLGSSVGKTVTVDGKISGDTVTIASIK